MLVGAPYRVVQVPRITHYPQCFISVVGKYVVKVDVLFALVDCDAPELDIHVFVTARGGLDYGVLCQGDWRAVKVRICRDPAAGEIEYSRCQIRVGGHDLGDMLSRDVGAADNQRYVDIFLDSACLAWWESMLANMISIIGCVKDVCVIRNAQLLQAYYNALDELIHGLECTETRAVEMIIEIDFSLIELGQLQHPIGPRRFLRIEIVRSRNFYILEQLFVTLGWNGRREDQVRERSRHPYRRTAVGRVLPDITVRGHGRDS